MKKRTAGDEDGRKAREIPKTRHRMARIKEESRKEKLKPGKKSKTGKNYCHQLINTTVDNFIPVIDINHLYLL